MNADDEYQRAGFERDRESTFWWAPRDKDQIANASDY
jgi:hypothetical protein